jgi:DNA-binding NarL/FixJ family response regulator
MFEKYIVRDFACVHPNAAQRNGGELARILLVEDNLKFRQLLKGLVEAREGWHVCGETGDGVEAVAKAVELKPDVVVLDFAIPRLNGLQVAAKLTDVYPTLPIILHTVHVFPAMIEEAKKIGIREVVTKSETVGHLLDVIETLLEETTSDGAKVPGTQRRPQLSAPEIKPDKQNPEPN